MFRITLLLCFGIAGWMNSSAQASGDTIIWKSRNQLTYEDFKGKVPPEKITDSMPFHAVASIQLCLDYKIQLEGGKASISAHAGCVRSKSWMIDRTPKTLEHEQNHFNIAEMYARQLQQTVNSYAYKSIVDFMYFLNEQVKKTEK